MMDLSKQHFDDLNPKNQYSFDKRGNFCYCYNIHYFNAAVNPVQGNFLTVLAPRITSAEDLIRRVGKELNIMTDSLQVFGLFWGNLVSQCSGENVAELVHETDSQSTLRRSMTFRRLSFVPDVERKIVERDPVARDLLFWEAASTHFNHNSLMLLPCQKTQDFLGLSKCTIMEKKSRLFGILHNDPLYWKSHYNVKCVAHSTLLANSLIRLGATMCLGMGYEEMTLYEEDGTNILASINWDMIYSVEKLLNANVVIFKLLYDFVYSGKLVLRSFVIESEFQNYIYSIVFHLLKIRSKQNSQKSLPPGCKIEASTALKGSTQTVSILQEPVAIYYNSSWSGLPMVVDDNLFPAVLDEQNDISISSRRDFTRTSSEANDLDKYCQLNESKIECSSKLLNSQVDQENTSDQEKQSGQKNESQKLLDPESIFVQENTSDLMLDQENNQGNKPDNENISGQSMSQESNAEHSQGASEQSLLDKTNDDYFLDLQRRCAKRYLSQPNLQVKDVSNNSTCMEEDENKKPQSIQNVNKSSQNSDSDYENSLLLNKTQIYTNRYFSPEFTFSAEKAAGQNGNYNGERVASDDSAKKSSCSSLFQDHHDPNVSPSVSVVDSLPSSCCSLCPMVRPKSARYNRSGKFKEQYRVESARQEKLREMSLSEVPSSTLSEYCGSEAYFASNSDMCDDFLNLKADEAPSPDQNCIKSVAALKESKSSLKVELDNKQQLVPGIHENMEKITRNPCQTATMPNISSHALRGKSGTGRPCQSAITTTEMGRNKNVDNKPSQRLSPNTSTKPNDKVNSLDLSVQQALSISTESAVDLKMTNKEECYKEAINIESSNAQQDYQSLDLSERECRGTYKYVRSDILPCSSPCNNGRLNSSRIQSGNKMEEENQYLAVQACDSETCDAPKEFLNEPFMVDVDLKSSSRSEDESSTCSMLRNISVENDGTKDGKIKTKPSEVLIDSEPDGKPQLELADSCVKTLLSSATLEKMRMAYKSETVLRNEENQSSCSFEKLSLDNQANLSDSGSDSDCTLLKDNKLISQTEVKLETTQNVKVRSLIDELENRPPKTFGPHLPKITFRSTSSTFNEFLQSHKKSPLYENKLKLKRILQAESPIDIEMYSDPDTEEGVEIDDSDDDNGGGKEVNKPKSKLKNMKSCPAGLNERYHSDLERKLKGTKSSSSKHNIITRMKSSAYLITKSHSNRRQKSTRKSCKKIQKESELNEEVKAASLKVKSNHSLSKSCSMLQESDHSESPLDKNSKILLRSKTSSMFVSKSCKNKDILAEQERTDENSASTVSIKFSHKKKIEKRAQVKESQSDFGVITGETAGMNLQLKPNRELKTNMLTKFKEKTKSVGDLSPKSATERVDRHLCPVKKFNSIRFQDSSALPKFDDKLTASLLNGPQSTKPSLNTVENEIVSSVEENSTCIQLDYVKQTDLLSSQMVKTLVLMDPSPVKLTPSWRKDGSNLLKSLKNRPFDEVEERHRLIMVSYYPGQVVYVQIKPSQFVTAEMVKQEVGKVLQIGSFALGIFGLFKGTPGHVTELLVDSDVIPDAENEFILQRLSLDKDSEKLVLHHSPAAVDILYWEFRDRFETGQLFPGMSRELNDQITDNLKVNDIKTREWEREHGLTHKRYNCPDCNELRKALVNSVLQSSEVGYEQYYRVDRCTTRDILVYIAPRPYKRMEISVSLNFSQVVFLHSSGKMLHSIPWELIKSVQMQLQPKPLVLFEVLICEESYCVYKFVAIRTKQAKYIFSIANYIMELYSNMPAKPVSLRSINLSSKKMKPVTFRLQRKAVSAQDPKMCNKIQRAQLMIPAKEGTDPFTCTDAMSLLVYGIEYNAPMDGHASSSQLKYDLPPILSTQYCLTVLSRTKQDSRPATAPTNRIRPLFYKPIYKSVPRHDCDHISHTSLHSSIPEVLEKELKNCDVFQGSHERNKKTKGGTTMPPLVLPSINDERRNMVSSRLQPIDNNTVNSNRTINIDKMLTTSLGSNVAGLSQINPDLPQLKNMERTSQDRTPLPSLEKTTRPNSNMSKMSLSTCDLVSSPSRSGETIRLIDHDLDSSYKELAGPIITSESKGKVILYVPYGNQSLTKGNLSSKAKKSPRDSSKTTNLLQKQSSGKKSNSLGGHLNRLPTSKNEQKSYKSFETTEKQLEKVKQHSYCSSGEIHKSNQLKQLHFEKVVSQVERSLTMTGDSKIADLPAKLPSLAFSAEVSNETLHTEPSYGSKVSLNNLPSDHNALQSIRTSTTSTLGNRGNSKNGAYLTCKSFPIHQVPESAHTILPSLDRSCDQSSYCASSTQFSQVPNLPQLIDSAEGISHLTNDDDSHCIPNISLNSLTADDQLSHNGQHTSCTQESAVHEVHKYPHVHDEHVVSPDKMRCTRNHSAILPPPFDNTPPKEPGYPGYVCVEPPVPYERPQPVELEEKTGTDLINGQLYIYKRIPLKHAVHTPLEELHDHNIGKGERSVSFNPRYSGAVAWEDRQIGPNRMHHVTRKWNQWKSLLEQR